MRRAKTAANSRHHREPRSGSSTLSATRGRAAPPRAPGARPFLLVATARGSAATSPIRRRRSRILLGYRLEPFDFPGAAVLSAIAAEEEVGADGLLAAVGARIANNRHLAGSQPRIWALLASALAVEGLGELVELSVTQFDDLTPYYQERLAPCPASNGSSCRLADSTVRSTSPNSPTASTSTSVASSKTSASSSTVAGSRQPSRRSLPGSTGAVPTTSSPSRSRGSPSRSRTPAPSCGS